MTRDRRNPIRPVRARWLAGTLSLSLAGAALAYHASRPVAMNATIDSVDVALPDDTLGRALEWAMAIVEASLACHRDPACALDPDPATAAGRGPSASARFAAAPAWLNSFAAVTYGALGPAAAALEPRHRTPDMARATPSPWWVVAVYEHWLQSAEHGLIRAGWPDIFDAYRRGLEEDADGDVIPDAPDASAAPGTTESDEGFPGARHHIYPATIWIESLRATSDIAAAVGELRLAREASQSFQRAWSALARRYYIPDSGTYASTLVDGAADTTITAWPAVALAFSLLENDRAGRTLDFLASHRLATGGGAAAADADDTAEERADAADPLGDDRRLLPGFAAWGLYNYHRPHAGLSELRAIALSILAGAPGHDARNGRRRPEPLQSVGLDPATIRAAPVFAISLIRGLLGLRPDAPRNHLTFAPHLTVDWDSLAIRRYAVGSTLLDLELTHRHPGARATGAPAPPSVLTLRLRRIDGDPISILFAPALPPGSRVKQVLVTGRPVPFERKLDVDDVHAIVRFRLHDETVLRIEYEPGIAILAAHPPTGDGAKGRGAGRTERDGALRVLRYRHDITSGRYTLTVEGKGGRSYSLDLLSPRGRPLILEQARLEETGPGRYRLDLELEGSSRGYTQKEIRFRGPEARPAASGRGRRSS